MPANLKRIVLIFLLAVGGCVPMAPPYASLAQTMAPVAPGMARVFFYRWLEPYESLSPATAYLNGDAIAVTEVGAVLYRDVAPGQYTISIESDFPYPNQFKTIRLAPGDIAYVRIESLQSWATCGGGTTFGGGQGCRNTFVVQIIDPALARSEISDLRFIRG